MEKYYHVEVDIYQTFHHGERICGDVFISKRIPEENRVLAVLSDGMGSGVKANVLATLTATISLNLSQEHKDPKTIAEIIMKALPVCSERNTSYATYTIVDISIDTNSVNILEYDNPQTIIMRGKRVFEPNWEPIDVDAESDKRWLDLKTTSFEPQLEDRIIFYSDGITQSGLGMGMPTGWGRNDLREEIRILISNNKTISAKELSEKIVKRAMANDLHVPKDDLSCAVVYFREPRKMMLCTGPPMEPEKDPEFAQKLLTFSGKKVISGATTTEIIARESGRTVVDEPIMDHTLPPTSKMIGIDLITEGVLTLSKVVYLLSNQYKPGYRFGKGPADRLAELLLESDEIHILVGTKINEYNIDYSQPVEFEIRKNLIQRLTKVLMDQYMKVVYMEFM
ncbi:MAG TPA: SpoIIE family protein phosphatase [Bacteroidales bacterium]|nr:SpoIIE family protein phosphatase [Bacteroidales bacterium]HOH22273.1 SpoIIE family protein phosphatase [Bacteroidales bacterium]HPZ03680.1 SpoIIE family protein phosphatase [Bacteroidales bacterium]HQB75144.1 SpoIIE family protein phosphatase [Bacteroidales bacterium]HQQ21253.1 SpoIIE family protein phosphatase [Bacteroidales bacterium]